MKQTTLIITLTLILAGCTVPLLGPASVDPAQSEVETPVVETDPADTPAAPQPSSAQVVVALGDPSEPGLWIKTAIVSADRPGRVVTGNGRTLDVTLRPQAQGAGGGAQISLAAMQALRLPLTALTDVTISVRP